ncbi:MAG: hypothetical protein JWQ09_2744 [Segetibacter sp.]|nr:hypothetical protein [Segetibacter sp.]
MTEEDELIKVYDKCSEGYHRVDDFRAKLLGFLPLASGVAIFGALYIEPKDPLSDTLSKEAKNIISGNFVALGTFGVLITLGLLIYELKGIAKCTQFIFLGSWIESKMKESRKGNIDKKENFDNFLSGYFTELAKRKTIMGNVVTEPVASAIIYSTVIAAWSYVICLKLGYLKVVIPAIIFFVSAFLIIGYWRVIFIRIRSSFENSEDLISDK